MVKEPTAVVLSTSGNNAPTRVGSTLKNVIPTIPLTHAYTSVSGNGQFLAKAQISWLNAETRMTPAKTFRAAKAFADASLDGLQTTLSRINAAPARPKHPNKFTRPKGITDFWSDMPGLVATVKTVMKTNGRSAALL
ncbi:hypothetical protein FRB99_008183 [Tulasnella sp. 403]|nr:hypothetical protein FRB99_008183 [Tulasnella sp. 403]